MNLKSIEALQKIGDVNLLSDKEAQELYSQIKPGVFSSLIEPDAARLFIKNELLKAAGVSISGGVIIIGAE